MLNDILQKLATQFLARPFDESEVCASPFEQFNLWMEQALESQIPEPHAMIVASATLDAKPSARVVLLRGFDTEGFVFYTNYESRKAKEMEQNPQVELLFYWHVLGRQIRIEGTVVRVSQGESQEYFSTRPRESQIGAWASRQSSTIASREELENQFALFEKQFADETVPLPPTWGGYRVKPKYFEFWQGRESRLHDRISYTLEQSTWRIQRLSP